MIRLRRISVIATATTIAIAAGAVVLVFAVLALLSISIGRGGPMGFPGMGGGPAVLIVPIVYAALVWVVTALMCAAYNVAAGWTGGIGFIVEREPAEAPSGESGR